MWIALLRAVNVGATNRMTMRDLHDLVAGLGFAKVRTHLAAGNVVFEGGGRSGAAHEALIERELGRGLQVRTDVIVRSASEWRAAIAANPFTAEAAADPAHLLVHFTKSAPVAGAGAALAAAVKGRERTALVGREAYLVYPDGIGRSRLTAPVIEKALGVTGTARNWKTVQALGALAAAD